MDTLQIILITVLTLLALNLIGVGIYVIIVLKEFRETIKKANRALDMANHTAMPMTTIAGIMSGVTQGVKAIKEISNLMETRAPRKKEDR
jgi:uncharacterized protein YoxC